MKKFLIISTIILLLVVAYLYFHYELGIYIDFHPNKEVNTFVKTDKKQILLDKGNGFEVFKIKGVDIGSGIPGEFATSYAIDKDTYKRWFKLIQEMGANTIRVYTIQNTAFYNAFYEYNLGNDNPLYLIHGLWVNDYVQNSRLDAYSKDFRKRMLIDSEKLVDVIHGRRVLSIGGEYGSGIYLRDISKWVIGYILGVEWEDVTVEFTNQIEKEKKSFKGDYMYSSEDASSFEVFLTEIGNNIIAYESSKYKMQKIVAFSNWPTTDPFDYSEDVSKYFKKITKVDVEHILTTDKFLSGQFVSYHIYPYYPDYLNYEKEYDKYKYKGVKNTYQAYLKKINDYHTMPVVISEFGVPTSRAMAQKDMNTNRNQGNMDEVGQGKAIIDCYNDMLSVGIENAIIFTWHDEWFKRTWNTMHANDLLRTPYWSDFQTNEQFFGILTFDPGKEKSVSYNDGDVSEWAKEDVVSKKDNISLSMKYDEKFIYFYINKKDYQKEKIFIPIDITPKSGSKEIDGYNIKFDKDVDFLLVIDGKDNSRLLVQERYNTLNAMFGYETDYKNSYLNIPSKNSNKFTKINLLLQTATPLLTHNKSSKAEVYETGKLIYGNGNPESSDFYSISDFYINGDNIEIRIPYGLLNFLDPSTMRIHDDYYINYGVDEIKIKSINVGVGLEGKLINLESFKLAGWNRKITYHERLKKSYYMIQELWNEGVK